MRVAIYARVSTGEQSPELHLRELRDYAGLTPQPNNLVSGHCVRISQESLPWPGSFQRQEIGSLRQAGA